MYSGPIGAILTPQFEGLEKNPWLPHASSLCGACGEVCPVKIEIPRLLLELRSDIEKGKAERGEDKLEKLGFQGWAKLRIETLAADATAGAAASWVMQDAGVGGWVHNLPWFMNLGPVAGGSPNAMCPSRQQRAFGKCGETGRRHGRLRDEAADLSRGRHGRGAGSATWRWTASRIHEVAAEFPADPH
ncbi:MAG: hypothetical protein U5J83_07630 [Bryobacterales bacterium]|nr:hypothetical protein [Bryobacterales bacterium]